MIIVLRWENVTGVEVAAGGLVNVCSLTSPRKYVVLKPGYGKNVIAFAKREYEGDTLLFSSYYIHRAEYR